MWSVTHKNNSPRVQEKRCIRLFHKKAQCTSCLDVCPTEAITIGRPGTSVMVGNKCINCELCVAVCKVDTFSRSSGGEKAWIEHLSGFTKERRLTISCPHALNKRGGLVNCLGSFHPPLLLGFMLEGVRELHLHFGKCNECETGKGKELANKAVAQTVEILKKNQLTPPEIEFTSSSTICTPPFLSEGGQAHHPDRRDMLFHLLKGVKHLVDFRESDAGGEDNSFDLKYKLLQQYLNLWAQKEGQPSRTMLAHLVMRQINNHVCKGCGLCAVICRNSAVVQQSAKGVPELILENCCDCDLCNIGCPQQAISNHGFE